MKNNHQKSINSLKLQELTFEEMNVIDGGGFWDDVFYTLGATARCIYEFSKTAGEYQSSLPHYLKK